MASAQDVPVELHRWVKLTKGAQKHYPTRDGHHDRDWKCCNDVTAPTGLYVSLNLWINALTPPPSNPLHSPSQQSPPNESILAPRPPQWGIFDTPVVHCYWLLCGEVQRGTHLSAGSQGMHCQLLLLFASLLHHGVAPSPGCCTDTKRSFNSIGACIIIGFASTGLRGLLLSLSLHQSLALQCFIWVSMLSSKLYTFILHYLFLILE